MRRNSILLAAAVLTAVVGTAADAQVGIGDNDRVVFYGDKLARAHPPGFAQGYGSIVEGFVRIRYPESKARYWHIGSKDYAAIEVANEQFDDLVAPLKPTVVVLNWGLGDGQMKRFDPARLETVRREFGRLVDRCVKLGAKVFVMLPPRPNTSKKNLLRSIDYDVTVRKIADAMADVAAKKGVISLDWFQASAALASKAGQHKTVELSEPDGLLPTPIGHALAANMLLDEWGLTPLEVTVKVDWTVQTASTTHGHVEVAKAGENVLSLNFTDFPMPLYTGVGKATFSENFAFASFCRIVLKIDQLPAGAVVLAAKQSRRRRPTPISGDVMRGGYNLAVGSPLSAAKDVREMYKLLVKKNYACTQMIDGKLRAGLDSVEPELLPAHETNVLLRRQYNDGLAKILQRTARTVDFSMDIKLVPEKG